MRTIQLAALAAVMGVTTVACSGKDSATGIATTGGGEGEGEGEGEGVGDISGTAGVYIYEAACDVVWDMAGSQCAGCDLGWDVSLTKTGGSCGADTSGTFEVVGNGAYWNGDYWGYASAGGGAVAWATVGYVYGAGGYTYSYYGSATY